MLPEYLSLEKIKELEIIFKAIPDCLSYQSSKFYAGIQFNSELSEDEFEALLTQYPEINFCKSEAGVSSLIPGEEFYFFFIFECEGVNVNFALKDRDNHIHLPGPFPISDGNYRIIALVIPYVLEGEIISAYMVKEGERCYVVIEKFFEPVIEVIDAP